MRKFLVLFALIALTASLAVLACGEQASAKDAAAQDCLCRLKGVERTVANLANGAEIRMTSSDADVVRTLQAKLAGCPKSKGCCKDCPMASAAWSRKVENTQGGVVLTLTADSKDDVQKIQDLAAGMAKGGCPHQKAEGDGGCPKRERHHGEKA